MAKDLEPVISDRQHREGLTRNVISIIVVPLTVLMMPILAIVCWLSFYVSPIDVIFANEKVIASVETTSGDTLELTQFWNRGDFYTTTIKRRDSHGNLYEAIVDPDDNKIWRGGIARDDATEKLVVHEHGKPVYSIDPDTWRITHYNASDRWETFLSRVTLSS